jgi:hypothetical protein
VSVGNLEQSVNHAQMPLFDGSPQKDRKLAAAMDDISRRFGGRAITRAELVPKKKQ